MNENIERKKGEKKMSKMGYGYGSEFHLLRWMGRHRDALNGIVEPVLGLSDVHWLDFKFEPGNCIPDAELEGLADILKDDPREREKREVLEAFEREWPQHGTLMNWDAVAVGKDADGELVYVLCEAKAHLEEVEKDHDPGDSPSVPQREEAFRLAKGKIGADAAADWMHTFYQMANRLYAMAVMNAHGIPAKLLNIYFCGDVGRNGWECPRDAGKWKELVAEEYRTLGVDASNWFVSEHVKNVFLPVCPENGEQAVEWNRLRNAGEA